jgi:hypothetical protein
MIDDPNRPPFGGSGMTKEERRATHERWAAKEVASSSLKPGTKEYEMYSNGKQCGGCAFYLEVGSDLGMDWGCCANAKSAFDARVVFEHHTCLEHTERPEKGEECPTCFGGGMVPCTPCQGMGSEGEKK